MGALASRILDYSDWFANDNQAVEIYEEPPTVNEPDSDDESNKEDGKMVVHCMDGKPESVTSALNDAISSVGADDTCHAD